MKTILLLTCVLGWVLREAATKMELNEMWTLLEETPVRERVRQEVNRAGGRAVREREEGWKAGEEALQTASMSKEGLARLLGNLDPSQPSGSP